MHDATSACLPARTYGYSLIGCPLPLLQPPGTWKALAVAPASPSSAQRQASWRFRSRSGASAGRRSAARTPRFRRRRQDLEPRRQHLVPVNPDLPGPRLVGEENDVLPAFVDAVQEAEDDVEGLADLGWVCRLRLLHTAIE